MIVAQPTGELAHAFWIDLDQPTEDEVARVRSATGLRVPSRAEVSEIELSSRLGFESSAFYCTTPLVAVEAGEPAVSPAGFVLSERVLITVRFGPLAAFDAVHEAARRGAGVAEGQRCTTAEEAFLRLLEVIVDRYADALEHEGTQCDGLSSNAFRQERSQPGPRLRELLSQIGHVADRTSRIRDALLGLGRVASFVTESNFTGAPKVSHPRLKAIRADLTSLTDYEAHLSSKVQFLLDATLGFVNIEQNEIVKTLTIASVVGVPPVLVAGIYGMNFHAMPELSWPWGYPLALGLIVFSALVPLAWFKWRRWM